MIAKVQVRDWEAEDDARILARAIKIKSDKNRYEKAKNAAKKLLNEKEEFIDSLKEVANSKTIISSKEKRLNVAFHNSVNSSRG